MGKARNGMKQGRRGGRIIKERKEGGVKKIKRRKNERNEEINRK